MTAGLHLLWCLPLGVSVRHPGRLGLGEATETKKEYSIEMTARGTEGELRNKVVSTIKLTLEYLKPYLLGIL